MIPGLQIALLVSLAPAWEQMMSVNRSDRSLGMAGCVVFRGPEPGKIPAEV